MLTSIQELARQWTAAQPGVSIFISSIIPNVHDAQDVLQDVAAAIFSYDFEKQGVPASFRAWAMGIARHKAIDFYRRKSARGRALLMDTATIDQLVRANEEIVEEIDHRREALHQCMGQMLWPKPGITCWTALQVGFESGGDCDAGEGGGERGEDGVIPAAECT